MLSISGALIFVTVGVNQSYKWPLYFGLALTLGAMFNWSRQSRFDRHIGELSYPIYIAHMFVAGLVGVVAKRAGFALSGEIVLLLLVPFSMFLYVFIDNPLSAWRARFARGALRATPDRMLAEPLID